MSLAWFLSILLLTGGIFFFFLYYLRHFDARVFLAAFTFFYYFYNGVGLAYEEISIQLRIYYVLFYIVFCASFTLVFRVRSTMLTKAGDKVRNLRVKSFGLAKVLALVYVATVLLPLVYPSNVISRLIHPPVPDLLGNLNDFQPAKDSSQMLMKIIFYAQTLCFPFFIFHFDLIKRKRKILFFLLIGNLLNYVGYVQTAYISRSDILSYIQIALLVFFLVRQRIRFKHVAAISVPIIMVILIFSAYQDIRLGNDAGDSGGVTKVLTKAFETEIGFPKDVMQKIIDKKMTTDLPNYFLWLATLPIPKILMPNLIHFELNKDISQVLLGIPPDDQYFFILLPGVLGEGIYIYGIYFFFLHALFCGILFGCLMRVFKYIKQYPFLLAYLMVLMSYYTCRGGIVSSLPVMVNGNLLFILYVLFLQRVTFKKEQVREINT